MAHTFQIEQLDHVAIRVKDIELSAQWYENILGLKRLQPEEWKPWPIFMLAGSTGIALFPEKKDSLGKVDHIAFSVTKQSFELARAHLKEKGIAYTIQDHVYFDSIYFTDIDNHVIELTMQKKALEGYGDAF